jgi:hypothetical protein
VEPREANGICELAAVTFETKLDRHPSSSRIRCPHGAR